MSEGKAGEPWRERLRAFIERLDRVLGPVEGVILFGSWARGEAGIWSDVDVLVVSDALAGLSVPDRIGLLLEHAKPPIQPLGYTFDELARMVRRANPLALSALIEGVFLRASERLVRLAKRARAAYERRGRVWRPKRQL